MNITRSLDLQPYSRAGWRRALLVCLAISSTVVAGCGGEPAGPPTVPVTGKVTLNGNPLPFGVVQFVPDAAKGNTSQFTPNGMINDGVYKLLVGEKEGAPLGAYKVTVNTQVPIDPTKAKTAVPINRKYQTAQTTDLAVEVVAKPAAGAYDLALTN